jgi:hypothetical protein
MIMYHEQCMPSVTAQCVAVQISLTFWMYTPSKHREAKSAVTNHPTPQASGGCTNLPAILDVRPDPTPRSQQCSHKPPHISNLYCVRTFCFSRNLRTARLTARTPCVSHCTMDSARSGYIMVWSGLVWFCLVDSKLGLAWLDFGQVDGFLVQGLRTWAKSDALQRPKNRLQHHVM